MKTSDRLAQVRASLTMEIDGRAKEYRAEGRDVIGLAAGEPDFMPPAHVAEAAKRAIDEGRGRYTAVAGDPALRRAISQHLTDRYGLDYAADDVVVSSGAKQSLFNALYVLCDEGDQVLIPTPYWTSYPEMARALGLEPVFCETRPEEDFRLRAEDIEARIGPRTRAIILNSPANPSGRVLTRGELEELHRVLEPRDIWVISDDIYAELVFDGHEFLNLPMIAPSMRDRCLLINGLSKAFCMTGWRVGYAAGPTAVIAEMRKIQSHTTSCANAIAQVASTAALEQLDPVELRKMVEAYQQRSEFVHASLIAIDGVRCLKPQATFYAFPDFSALLGRDYGNRRIDTSLELAAALLDESLVAMVPGEAFGAPGCLRLSFASSMEDLERAFERIRAFFAR